MSSLNTAGATAMNPHSCSCCGRSYTLELDGRLPNSWPYLLRCGHVFCGTCLQDKSKRPSFEYACPACKMVTMVTGAGGLQMLPLDYYALGVVAAYKYACSVPRYKQNLESQVVKSLSSLPDGVLLETQGIMDGVCLNIITEKERSCAECGQMKAALCCNNCQDDFCNSCFQKVHKHAKVLQNHKANIIDPSDCDICNMHSKPYTYYCDLDGSSVVCDDCITDSEHSDHGHTLLDAKQKEMSLQLSNAIVVGQARVSKLKEVLQEFEIFQSRLQLQLQTAACSVNGTVYSICAMVQARGEELALQLKDMEDQLHPVLTKEVNILHEAYVSNCVALNTACNLALGQICSLQDIHKVVDQLLKMDIPELCVIFQEKSLNLQCDLDTTQLMTHIKEFGTIKLPTRLLECCQSISVETVTAGLDSSPAGVMLLPSIQQQRQSHGSHAVVRDGTPMGPIKRGLKLAPAFQDLQQVNPMAIRSKRGLMHTTALVSSASPANCFFPGKVGGVIPAGAESSFVSKRKIGNTNLSRMRPSGIPQGQRSDDNILKHLIVDPAQLVNQMLVDESIAQAAEHRTHHKKTRALVSFVKSPASFYLQPDEALANFLPTLERLLKECFAGKPQLLAPEGTANLTQEATCADLAEGSLCALYSVNHNTWARARVISFLIDGHIQVLLLDYGDRMVVETGAVRHMDEACIRYPPLAVHCCLADLTPAGGSTEWSAGACNFLSDNIYKKYCFIKERAEMERDNPLPVQLTCFMEEDINHLKDVGDMLVHKGLAFHTKRTKGDSRVVHKRVGDYIVESVIKQMDNTVTPPQQRMRASYSSSVLPATDTFSLVVSHVSANGRIYGRLASNDAILLKLMDSIESEYGSNKVFGLSAVHFCPGQPCIVQLSGGWYRAEVLNVQTNTVQVRYVDYGGEDEVEPGAVHVTSRFTDVPPLCLECELCCLHLNEGNTKKAEMIEYLSKLLFGQTVTMTLQTPCKEASWPLLVDIHTEQGSLKTVLELAEPLVERCSQQEQRGTENETEQMDTEGHVQLREQGWSESKESFESMEVNVLEVEDMGEANGGALGSAVGEREEKRGDGHHVAASERSGGSDDQDEQEENVTWDEPLLFTLHPRPTGYSFLTLPSPGHYYPVTVTHVDCPNQVYIRLSASPPTALLEDTEDVQGLNPELMAALNRIHTLSLHLYPLKNCDIGSPCMALFSKNGRWCRARVKGPTLTSSDVLLVEYVDLGSCYEHCPTELRAIPVELLQFPVQTIKVRLWGLSPPSCVDPAADERLPSVSEWPRRTLFDVHSCVHGKQLVASTKMDARGPCVVLYHAAEPGGPLVYQHFPEEGLAQWEVTCEGAQSMVHQV